MQMSVTFPVNAWSHVIPPSTGDAVVLSKRQTYIRYRSQQEAGQPVTFIISLVCELELVC